jgi:hypothetical protein
MAMTRNNIMGYLCPLRNKCYSVRQTVEAINKIFIPAIRYRMAVIDFPDKWIKKMDNSIAWIINQKLGIKFRSSKTHLFKSGKYGAPELISLEQIQKQAIINTLVDTLNGDDLVTAAVVESNLISSKLIKKLKRTGVKFIKFNDYYEQHEKLGNWIPESARNG